MIHIPPAGVAAGNKHRRRLPPRQARPSADEDYYRRIAELVADWAFCVRIRADGAPIAEWIGGQFAGITGPIPEGLDLRELYRFVHPDDLPALREHEACLYAGKPHACELRFAAPAGATRWLRLNNRPVWDAREGRVVRVYGAVQDVTECVEVQNALRRTAATLQALIQAAPLGVIVIDRAGNITMWNPAATRIFGWTEGEVLGKPPPFIAEEQRDEYRTLIEAEMRGELHVGIERRRVRKDGTPVEVALATAPVRDESGAVVATIRMLTDITDKQRDHERLRQYAEDLRALSHRVVQIQESERRAIARELHDEVGQALTGLRLGLEASLRSAPAEARPHLAQAMASASEAIAHVRDLALDLRPAALDDLGLAPALSALVDRYTAQTSVMVRLDIAANRRFAAEIETAAYRIVQEALTNVARHAGVKQAAVGIREAGAKLLVEIADQGAGFAVHKATAARASVGLTGMRERAESLGGRLAIDSEPGEGTVVRAELPLARDPRAEAR